MSEPWLKENGGKLDPEKHGRLIQVRDTVARDARIPVELLWKPLPAALSDVERNWLRKFKEHRKNGISGLIVFGDCADLHPLARFGAMAGFLNRNFVRARVFPLEEVIDSAAEGDPVAATALFIPDFVMGSDKKAQPQWRVSKLSSLLMDRWRGEGFSQTVLYAPSIKHVENEYGSFIGGLIKNHYMQVAA